MPLTRRTFAALTGVTAAAAIVPTAFEPASAATLAGAKHKPKHHHKHKHKHKHKPKPPSISSVEHLLRRTTYGATPALVTAVRRKGINAWLDEQMHPGRVRDTAMNKLLERWPSQKLAIWEVRQQYGGGAWDVMQDLVDTHIARATWSNRQLLEVMVDFWSNHLNVTCPSSDVWDNRHVYDRQVIRAHAFGKFSDMLWASAVSPAMMQYLGNAQSNASAGYFPNENYGRELLELHSVGLGAKYTQLDVHNSALILSGMTVEPDSGLFVFDPRMHYVGPVKVMGFKATTNGSNGLAVAKNYVHYLSHHHQTALRIATKLATRFVSDTPSEALIKHLAAVYSAHDTAIIPVLKALFASKAFANSVGHKVRTPYEDFIATLRVLRIGPPPVTPPAGIASPNIDGVRRLQYATGGVGQPPLAWALPNGYPDVATAWASTSATLGKWNAHAALTHTWITSNLTYYNLLSFVPKTLPKTYSDLMKALAAELNVPALNATQINALCIFMNVTPTTAVQLSDNTFQANGPFPYLIALILDSSHQAER